MREPTEPIRVLQVDDDPSFLEVASTFLERENDRFVVETATTAGEGLDRLDDGGIDCVVADYDMPGRNGIEFLEAVREDSPELPFVLYTGRGSEEVASEAISAGVTDYVRKESGTDQYAVLANRIENFVERARTQRERQRQLDAIETAREGISILGEEDRFVYVNEAYADLYGYDPGEMRGEHWALIYPDEEVAKIRDEILPAVEAEGHWRGTTTGLRADGTTFVEDHTLATTGRGELVCTVRDVTDHREREQQLAASRRRFEAVFEASNDAILILDPDENAIVDANPRAEELLGYSREELVSSVAISDVHPADTEQYREFLDTARAKGIGRRGDFRCVTKAAEPRDCEISVATAEFDGGRYLIATVRDITERKRRERTIEELHSTAQSLSGAETADQVADIVVESMRDILDMPVTGIWFHDGGALRPAAWTERAAEIVDEVPTFQPGESLAWSAFGAGEIRQYDDVSAVSGAYNPETSIRSELLVPLADHGVIVAGSRAVGAFDSIDVSLAETVATHAEAALDRIEREATLRTERETVEQLFETSPVAITIVGPDGVIRRANEHAEAVLGLTRSEITDRTYDDPEWGIVDEDGPPIPAEDLPFRRVLDTGEPVFDYEHGIEWPDGTRRWLSINAAPLTDEDGDVEAVIAVTKDVTDRREREREIERQNERLDRFASVVSHDLRNPLTVAGGNLELAREECESEHLEGVADALDRMSTLIDDVLALAREGDRVTGTEAVELAAMAERCWEAIETGAATLAVDTRRTIRADPGRLRQLLENLLRNAVEHGSTGPPSQAQGDAVEHGDDVTVTAGDLDDGRGFYVADDGPGVPGEERDQVFEAGYSTSASGTGFGLSIVTEIADAHDWDVAVTDSADGGARFEIGGVETVEE